MGVEGQFTESFAGWSHEVRRGQPLVPADDDRPALQAPRFPVPNIVKYRLLPTTAVVAIALTAPGFSSDAGTLPQQSPEAFDGASIFAPADTAKDFEPRVFAVQEELALVGGGAELPAAPIVADPVAMSVAPDELVSVPQALEVASPMDAPAQSGITFAEAFEPLAQSSIVAVGPAAELTIDAANSISAALPETVRVAPIKPAIAIAVAAPAIDQAAPAATQLIPAPAPQFTAVELGIAALANGPVVQPSLATVQIETIDLPLIAIAPVESVDKSPSLTADDTRSLALQSNPVQPAIVVPELASQAAPVRQTIRAAAQPLSVPAVDTELAVPSSAAITPQLTSMPPGRGGPARNDAMPIEVAKPQAVATPAAKTSVSSAQPAGFANVVDPRRPASQPVSGTVSGFDLNIQSQLITRIDGRIVGQLDFQQTNKALSVRLGSIVALLKDRYDMHEFARISASSASDVFVTMAQLRDAGIPITYDPVYDEFNVGTREHRPTNAHKVQIDQIGSPGRGTARSGMVQARP